MKVGDHLWHFDRDRLIYRRDENNRSVGDNRYKIERLLQRASADQLMECAKILGFKEDDK